MSKYTTELRFICESLGGNESVGANDVDSLISSVRNRIFDFEYPLFDSNYKSVLETKIIKHFFTREIGEETYGLWKLRLNTKMNEIMPFYNQMYKSELIEYNPLYTVSLDKNHSGGKNDTDTRNSSTTGTTTNNGTGSTTENGTNSNLNLYSDTPQGGIINLNENGYLTNATKDNGTNSSTVNTTNNNTTSINNGVTENNKYDSLDYYTDTIVGYQGVSPAKAIMEFRKAMLNIDVMIISDLEELFIQLW